MHDLQTLAFEIKNPFVKKRHGYRPPLITIWHIDPERNVLGCCSDDSCGWFSPPYTEEERDSIVELAKQQYQEIFSKQVAESKRRSYAYACYDQDPYGVIYWSWRAIKAMGKKGWQYGSVLSHKELDFIYRLATNPVDNLQYSAKNIKNEQDFVEFFMNIWRNFRGFNRKWYQHPRWHIHHWKIQFHIWQQLKRRYWDKCSVCGKRGFKGSAYGDWSGTKIWHEECNTHSKSIAH